MNIVLNGAKQEVAEKTTLLTLLEEYNLQTQRVVVELNKEIVEKANFAITYLSEGDSLEVIQFVPGG